MTKVYKNSKLYVFILLFVFFNKGFSQSDLKFSNYKFEKTDSLKIRKLIKSDNLTRYVNLNDNVIYYSNEAKCLVVSNIKTQSIKKAFFLPNWMQDQNEFNPFMVNFGKLNDSTLVVIYENRWPYVEDKIFLFNPKSNKISFPFHSNDTDFASKYDSKVSDFNYAQQKFKSWFAVSNYELPVRASDTTVFIPIYTGNIGNNLAGKLRSIKNCVLPISTKFHETEKLELSFSQTNTIYDDSFNTKDEFYKLTNNLLSCHTKKSFILSFWGHQDAIEYNYENKTAKIISINIPILNIEKHTANHNSKSIDSLIKFWSFTENSIYNYSIRGLQIPSKSNSKKFTYFVFNKELECIGIINKNLENSYIRGVEDTSFIAINIGKTEQNDSWFFIEIYKIINCGIQNIPLNIFNLSSNKNDSNLINYISKISAKLLETDTIPIILNNKSCPSCIHKTMLFLNTLQLNKSYIKPIIIVSNDLQSQITLLDKYSISKDSSIYFDNEGLFTSTTQELIMGQLIKENGKYYFKKIEQSKMSDFLKFINPNLSNDSKFCFPIED
jgi:hypothetical protein